MLPTPESLLHAALRAAPRRYRLPPLPADAGQALADGASTAVAFGLEAMRVSQQHRVAPPSGAQDVFTAGLAALIRAAMAPQHGDPAYQAIVLRQHDGEVDAHAKLVEQAAHDRRALRAAVDAVAHPGKLRQRAPDAAGARLAPLHALAAEGHWSGLRSAIERALAERVGDDWHPRESLRRLLAAPALERLERGDALLRSPGVQHYRHLLEQASPASGSAEAAASGRASARRGEHAEAEVVDVFLRIAHRLNQAVPSQRVYRVARGLRTPVTLGAASRAKAEWDAAIVCDRAGVAGAEIVLLAEVKSSPAAATADWPRMMRGLAGLSGAGVDGTYDFPSPDGPVVVTGASLRRLQPQGHRVPEHVVYCCTADPEARPPMLSAASKAVLLSQPACLAYGGRLRSGGSPPLAELAPLWQIVNDAPQLGATRCQYQTARAAREAMLHPADLLSAVERCAADLHRGCS